MKPSALLLALTLAIAPAVSQSASGAVLASYSAGTTGTAPNPETLGWTLSGNYGDAPNPSIPKAGTETIGDKSWLYWDVSNPSGVPNTNSAFSALYRQNLALSSFTDPAGWTATAILRVASAATTFNATFLQVSDGKNSWEVSFVKNATDGSSINYRSSSTNLVNLSTTDIGADYMTVQMYYDPLTTSVKFYLNGTQLGDAVAASTMPTALSNQLYIRWGDNSGSATAVRTVAHWNHVQFETGYAVVPEPNAVALLMGGGLLVLGARHGLNARKNR